MKIKSKYIREIIYSVLSLVCMSPALAANVVSIGSDSGFSKPFIFPNTTVVIKGHKVPLLVDLGYSMNDADIVLQKETAKRLGW